MPFREGYVTFLDILGFRNLIEKVEDSNRLDEFESLTSCIENYFDDFWKRFHPASERGRGKIALEETSTDILWISDSIIISGFDVEKNPSLALGIQGVLTILLGQQLLKKGFLVRGGTAKGKVYQYEYKLDEKIQKNLFGTAYMKAYELEKKAKNPIVELDIESSEIIEKAGRGMVIPKFEESVIEPKQATYCWDILKDYYLVPFENGIVDYEKMQEKIKKPYEDLRSPIIANIEKFRNDQKKFSKWAFMANYYNRKIEVNLPDLYIRY